MDEIWLLIVMLLVLALSVAVLVLPIVAIVISVRTRKKLTEQIGSLNARRSIDSATLQQLRVAELVPLVNTLRELETRTADLEAALTAHSIDIPRTVAAPAPPSMKPPDQPVSTPSSEPSVDPELSDPRRVVPQPSAPGPAVTIPPMPAPQARAIQAERIESIIGRRWLGWAAVSLILFAVAFFLKYAFDNRWIGELGRVAIGIAAGIGLTIAGFKYYQRRWIVFSQILTAGGVVILYLSVFAAFGFYHLATQKAAFAYLAILVAETAGLALLYDAPAIAIMALMGGFMAPLLLRSDRDQYGSLFGYIGLLDAGALVLLKHWPGLTSLAFAGTHLLFWAWYVDHFHPRKIVGVMIFQGAVFLLFLLAHLGRRVIRHQAPNLEDFCLLWINPFVFFATSYHLLNPDHHPWMGVFAIVMALVYAGAAKLLLDRSQTTRTEVLLLIGVAITFVTLAIPIQLRANWITIAWAVEALTMLWVGFKTHLRRIQTIAVGLFAMALAKLVFWDTPLVRRTTFTPILNKYFLSSLAVILCLFAAAALCRRFETSPRSLAPFMHLAMVLAAIVSLWFVMSVETQTYFANLTLKLPEGVRHEKRLGQMALSVLWSFYAGVLAAVGFIRRSAAVRWAALVLFGLTIVKVMLVDIAELQQLYRIIAFLVLGLLLLVVTWGYHKAFQSRESSQ
jgi:uncharacterized membrane protein